MKAAGPSLRKPERRGFAPGLTTGGTLRASLFLLVFFGGPLLCFIRLWGRGETAVLTWSAPWAILAAMAMGAAVGGGLLWLVPFHGKQRSIQRWLWSAFAAFVWSMIGVYLLGWYVEVTAFSGLPVKQTRIEAPVTGKSRSGRSNQYNWIRVRTPYSPNGSSINVPDSLYDRVDPDARNLCLILPIEEGRGRVFRARIDPPPELVTCGAGLKASS